jgi:hypothetical protein
LSHPTWLVTASSTITSAKNIRRGRDFATSVVPRLSSSIETRKPPEPPNPSPGIIDAYFTGVRRIVTPVLVVTVVVRVYVAMPPVGIISGGEKVKIVLLGCSGELPNETGTTVDVTDPPSTTLPVMVADENRSALPNATVTCEVNIGAPLMFVMVNIPAATVAPGAAVDVPAGDDVASADGVGVGVIRLLGLGDGVPVIVGVAVIDGVPVSVGVAVIDGVPVSVGVAVIDGVALTVGVAVGGVSAIPRGMFSPVLEPLIVPIGAAAPLLPGAYSEMLPPVFTT